MADRDEKDEKDHEDEAAKDEESSEKAVEGEGEARPAAKARAKGEGAAAKPSKKAKDEGDEPSADEEEEDEEARGEEEDEEEEEAPAPKPAAKRAGRGPGASRARSAQAPQQGGSLGKSVLLFFVIVIGLGAGFAILGKETPPQVAKPKWKTGDVVDVEITLVSTDKGDLACASTEEIGGKHCAFEAANKPSPKGSADDKTLLKPYTTTDQVNFTAAGLWSDPALAAGKLPASRFNVKCKYKVEGTLKSLGVRWRDGEQFFPNSEWWAGSVSNCKLGG